VHDKCNARHRSMSEYSALGAPLAVTLLGSRGHFGHNTLRHHKIGAEVFGHFGTKPLNNNNNNNTLIYIAPACRMTSEALRLRHFGTKFEPNYHCSCLVGIVLSPTCHEFSSTWCRSVFKFLKTPQHWCRSVSFRSEVSWRRIVL